MNNELRDSLWEELKLLQPKIDKLDDFTFRIKNWFLTIFIALTGYSIGSGKLDVLILNIFLIIIFYFYEIVYRMALSSFIDRSREIEDILREDGNITNKDMASPNLVKYIPKNKYDINLILKESWRRLYKYRVSLVYIGALFINFIIAMIFHESKYHMNIYTILISVAMILSIFIGKYFYKDS